MCVDHGRTPATTVQCPPGSIRFPCGDSVEVANEVKILGVTFDNKLTLDSFVAERRRPGMRATWNIHRLKHNGVPPKELLTYYICEVRGVEFMVPAVIERLIHKETHWNVLLQLTLGVSWIQHTDMEWMVTFPTFPVLHSWGLRS